MSAICGCYMARFYGKVMKEKLAPCKNLTFTPTVVKVLSALSEESRKQLNTLAEEILN